MQPEGFDDALGASYRLVDRLGEGATGEVWRAVDRRTDETVATKLLRREHLSDRDLVGRFIQERSVLVGLRHPAIVAVRDLVAEGERLAIVMEYVDGGSLREVLQARGPLPPGQAVDVAAAVLDGLGAAHEQHVVHRDVKPDNVLLGPGWESAAPGEVKLVDFGIARILTDRQGSTTGLLGTPEYMSPELLTRGVAEAAADVYGVGILLYELLAGRTPFAGPGNEYTIAHRHVTADPPPLALPDGLGTVLAALLEKDPARRPSATGAAAALRGVRPEVADLAALAPQTDPADFDSARGPATMVRGLTPGLVAAAEPGPTDGATGREAGATGGTGPGAPDLGTPGPGQVTTVRPVQRPSTTPPGRSDAAERERATPRPGWRDPRLVATVVVALVLIAAAVVWVALTGSEDPPPVPRVDPAPPGQTAATAQQLDPALPTGLTTTREATYDPEQGLVTVTLTYSTQKAPLTGPFLEVLPGGGDGCPVVTWQGARAQPNLPSGTGVTTACAWSVDVGTIEPQASVAVTATVQLPLEGEDSTTALRTWLDEAAGATTAVIADSELSSTSYAVQRLVDIVVSAPDRSVSQRTLPLTLRPVWPDGEDDLNPLYRSPAVGEPTELLTAVAGGEQGVRFSSGCSSGLAVSPDGLVVTALSVVPECTVIASVGNFTSLVSNPVAIVTRGG